MTEIELAQSVANIKMWLIRTYMKDLTGYFTDDPSTFTRMVTDGGKQLPSASPQGWANHISNLSIECLPYHLAELRPIFTQLAAWGLTVDSGILDEVAP